MEYKEYDEIVLKDGREAIITDILGPDSYVVDIGKTMNEWDTDIIHEDEIDYKVNYVNLDDYNPDVVYPEHTMFIIELDGKKGYEHETFKITQEDIEKVKAESKSYIDIKCSEFIIPDFILTNEDRALR